MDSRSEELVESWSNAVLEVEVAGGWVHPGDIAQARGTLVHLITGWNPMGITLESTRNQALDDLLVTELDRRDLERHRCVGMDRSSDHAEEGWCILGLSRDEAVALGAAFEQLAIYEVSESTTLVVLCDGSDVIDVTATA
jgi:hypothetical protein